MSAPVPYRNIGGAVSRYSAVLKRANTQATIEKAIKGCCAMLDNGLIRKTKSDKPYNISFTYNSPTYAGKYKGSDFSGEIKLADFVDLETGEFV